MYETTLEWKQGQAFDATLPSGQTMTFDGDTQTGVSPAEVLMPALGACAGIDIAIILQKKRQTLKSLNIKVTGNRAEKPPRYWTDMQVHFTVAGDVTEQAMQHAIDLASTKYCSVAATINKATKLDWTFSIASI